jgi:hypothetical protein
MNEFVQQSGNIWGFLLFVLVIGGFVVYKKWNVIKPYIDKWKSDNQ